MDHVGLFNSANDDEYVFRLFLNSVKYWEIKKYAFCKGINIQSPFESKPMIFRFTDVEWSNVFSFSSSEAVFFSLNMLKIFLVFCLFFQN